MSRKKRFVEELTEADIAILGLNKKNGNSSDFRTRCHVVLLSNKGYEVKDIEKILDLSRGTIYNCFNKWEKDKIEGLKTKPGQGRKPTLSIENSVHVEVVKKAVKEYAEKGTNLLAKIEEELEMEEELSMKILRPFLKKLSR